MADNKGGKKRKAEGGLKEEPEEIQSYTIPDEVQIVLRARVRKLRKSGVWRSKDSGHRGYNNDFADAIELILHSKTPNRMVADLAIVTSRIADVFDKEDEFVYDEFFRNPHWLLRNCNNRKDILNEHQYFLDHLQEERALSEEEKTKFVEMHNKAFGGKMNDPAKSWGKPQMNEFLNAQKVKNIALKGQVTGFDGFSSYDGTIVHLTEDHNKNTVPHELEHNIRRYVLKDKGLKEQAQLVSPAKDRSLVIDGQQSESGFVLEHLNGIPVPKSLISPFSASYTQTTIG